MTEGAYSALSHAFSAFVQEGDEVRKFSVVNLFYYLSVSKASKTLLHYIFIII